LPARTALLAEDETDLLLFPPLRAGWAPRGQPKEVVLSGRNARRVIFGALNLRTGSRFFLARERQRAADYQALLRLLHDRYRGWHIALLQDEDPSHTAVGSLALACEFGIELLWLPKRSPELNPMDTLWGQAKDVISANKQYTTIDEQVQRFVGHLEGLSAWETFRTTGLLSKTHWLQSVL
jgi:transposase